FPTLAPRSRPGRRRSSRATWPRAVRSGHRSRASFSLIGRPTTCKYNGVRKNPVRQVSKTLVRLNVETRCFHAIADAPWLELAAPGHRPTRLEYVQQLVAAYGFDAPLEAALAYTPHLDGFVDLHRRFRSGLIAADLIALGVRPG